jgi:hypothetical protein
LVFLEIMGVAKVEVEIRVVLLIKISCYVYAGWKRFGTLYRIMDKITITEAGRSILDLQPSTPTPTSSHLPPLTHLHI